MNETNENNKLQNISNQELMDEYVRRIKSGVVSQDEIILALIKMK